MELRLSVRRRWGLLTLLGAVLVGLAGYQAFLFFNPECCTKFTIERWRASCSYWQTGECNRRRMLDDLMRTRLNTQAPRADIEKILGDPEMRFTDPRINCSIYIVAMKLVDDVRYSICYDGDNRLCSHGFDCRGCAISNRWCARVPSP